jgi:hypothetical protein
MRHGPHRHCDDGGGGVRDHEGEASGWIDTSGKKNDASKNSGQKSITAGTAIATTRHVTK